MSHPGVLPPQSTPSSRIPAHTLSSKPLAWSLTTMTSTVADTRPLSPVINTTAASSTVTVFIPPLTLAVKPQNSNHMRSQSLPSLQRQLPKPIEYSVSPVGDSHSSSAANLLAQRREDFFGSQTFATYVPVSPRLRPVHSPGPVTPMQLEDDMEYLFPSITTPIKQSPLVTSALEEEMEAEEEFIEIRRSRY